MSKPEFVLNKSAAETWGHFDAPECFERGSRRCVACRARVNRYTQPQSPHAKGQKGRLLCSHCVEREADAKVEEGRLEALLYVAEVERTGLYLSGLRRARKESGLTPKKLYRAAGIQSSTYSKIENTRARASLAVVHALARKLGVEPEVLLS